MSSYKIEAKAVAQGIWVHLLTVEANGFAAAIDKARRKSSYREWPYWKATRIASEKGWGLGSVKVREFGI